MQQVTMEWMSVKNNVLLKLHVFILAVTFICKESLISMVAATTKNFNFYRYILVSIPIGRSPTFKI